MKIIRSTEDAFVGITLIVVTFVLFLNIILRYFFSANTTWAEEFIRYAIIWITFIGSAICFRKGKHVGVELLVDALPPKLSKGLQVIINILSIIFMVLLAKYGIDLVIFSMQTGQVAASLPIKTYWVYLAIPTGAILSLLHLIIDSYHLISNNKKIHS